LNRKQKATLFIASVRLYVTEGLHVPWTSAAGRRRAGLWSARTAARW